MGVRTRITKAIYGGLAEGEQVDRLPAAFSIGKNINYRKTHDVITLNQRVTKDSGTVIDALPHWIKDLQGTVYSYLQNGKIFQRISAGSWVSVKTVTASTGNGLGVDASYLYYANASFLGRFPTGGTWGVDNNDTYQNLTTASWSPIKYFANVDLLLVGNGGTLATYDYGAANYSGSRLTMPRGWKIRDIEEWGDYVAISIWAGTSLRQQSQGKLVLWDGLSETFNAIVDSAAGNVQVTQSDNNSLNVLAGMIGNIYRLENGELKQQRKIPFLNEDAGDNIEIFPGAKAVWKGIPHFGVAGVASGASFLRGVYSYGADKKGLPESLNMEYTISEDVTSSNVKIGSLHTAQDNAFYIGWANSTTYGIDINDITQQYATGYLETLQFHGAGEEEGYEKAIMQARLLTKPLTSGQSIVHKVKSNYSASFATVMTHNTANAVEMSVKQLATSSPFPRFRILQERFEFTSASGIAPELLSGKVDYETKLPS